MAISDFLLGGIFEFWALVFVGFNSVTEGWRLVPFSTYFACWAESNDTTLDFLAPLEDPHPTLPVFDQNSDWKKLWKTLKNFQKFSKKNLSSKIPKNAQNVKKSSKIFFENFHSKNLNFPMMRWIWNTLYIALRFVLMFKN